MNWKLVTFAVVLALIIGCGAGVVMNDMIVTPVRAQSGEAWEHVCTDLYWTDFKGNLVREELGNAGWEMVGLTFAAEADLGRRILACFKRHK